MCGRATKRCSRVFIWMNVRRYLDGLTMINGGIPAGSRQDHGGTLNPAAQTALRFVQTSSLGFKTAGAEQVCKASRGSYADPGSQRDLPVRPVSPLRYKSPTACMAPFSRCIFIPACRYATQLHSSTVPRRLSSADTACCGMQREAPLASPTRYVHPRHCWR
jgi:hypothetical protein